LAKRRPGAATRLAVEAGGPSRVETEALLVQADPATVDTRDLDDLLEMPHENRGEVR